MIIYKLLFIKAREEYPAQANLTIHLIVLWTLVGIAYDVGRHTLYARKRRNK